MTTSSNNNIVQRRTTMATVNVKRQHILGSKAEVVATWLAGTCPSPFFSFLG
jgi:hypothetical protein